MERYEVINYIRKGSFGSVMKCRQKRTDEIFAIKKIRNTTMIRPDGKKICPKEFQKEQTKILKKLHDERRVAQMMDCFRYKKQFFIVLEYVPGTLRKLVKANRGLGLENAKRLILKVCFAVSYIHKNNIVHKDIKAANVLISSTKDIKLCGFGSAKELDQSGTTDNNGSYTLICAAPEVLKKQRFGKPADIWSIGCLYYYICFYAHIFYTKNKETQLMIIRELLKPTGTEKQTYLFDYLADFEHEKRLLFAKWPTVALDFLFCCMKYYADLRPNIDDLLDHDNFMEKKKDHQHDKICYSRSL